MRHRTRRIASLGTLLCMAFASACSDDDHPSRDAAVDAAPDASAGESLTFVVISATSGLDDYTPLEGATVTFDAPGGTRTEITTGADGRATFEGIDWSLGSASVTAFKFGFTMRSGVNIDAAWVDWMYKIDDAVMLLIYEPQDDLPQVQISGTATGLDDPSHELIVQTLGDLNSTAWTGTANGIWQIRVPQNEPFTMHAIEQVTTTLPSGRGIEREVFGILELAHDPIATDTADIVLDFSTLGMTTFSADASALLPIVADSHLAEGTLDAAVCSGDVARCFGVASYLDVAPDGASLDVSYVWVEPAGLERVFTLARVTNGTEQSMLQVTGYPQPGLLGHLFEPPRWVTPADLGTVHPIQDPLSWEVFDTDIEYTLLRVYRNGEMIWDVIAGPSSTALTLPELPSTVPASAFLGAGTVQAQLTIAVLDWPHNLWQKAAFSQFISLQP